MTKLNALILSIIFITLLGCSSGAKRKVIVPKGEPEWLYSPQSGCDKASEICASGEGGSFNESDLHAKKALASIFETSIDAKFQFTKHSFSDSEITEMSEMVNNKVDENVKGILKASSIKERFKKDDMKFSLAVLDKNKSGKVLSQEIRRIDDEMKHFFTQNNRLYVKKLNVLFNQRELLNEKLTIMTSAIPSPITFSQIAMLKYKSIGGEKVKLHFVTDIPELIQKKFEETLTDIGYKINLKEDNDYNLYVSFKEKEEYLNVEGFKRFAFEVNIESKNNSGKRLGGHVINLVANGRSEKDAFAKVRDKLVKEFENNLEKLNLK